MKEAFIKVKRAFTRRKENNTSLQSFKSELEKIAEETIISLETYSRCTREALRDIRTM